MAKVGGVCVSDPSAADLVSVAFLGGERINRCIAKQKGSLANRTAAVRCESADRAAGGVVLKRDLWRMAGDLQATAGRYHTPLHIP